jgi:hypothetical protein
MLHADKCDINLFLPVYEADSPTTIDSGRGPVCTVSILEAITDGGPRHGGYCWKRRQFLKNNRFFFFDNLTKKFTELKHITQA